MNEINVPVESTIPVICSVLDFRERLENPTLYPSIISTNNQWYKQMYDRSILF